MGSKYRVFWWSNLTQQKANFKVSREAEGYQLTTEYTYANVKSGRVK